MDLSELKESIEILSTDWPVGFVTSRAVWAQLQKQKVPRLDKQPTSSQAYPPLEGVRLYPFRDVPKTELWCFYDREVLTRYLRLREEIGHKVAIQRLTAEIDDELIVEAEIRALLERS